MPYYNSKFITKMGKNKKGWLSYDKGKHFDQEIYQMSYWFSISY